MTWRRVLPLALMAQAAVATADVPAPMALVVMLKVITYDLAFDPQNPTDFVICIPVAPGQRADAEQMMKLLEGVASSKLGEHHVRIKTVSGEKLGPSLDGEHASAVLLLPETPAAVTAELRVEATKRRLYMLSLDPATVSSQQSMLGVAEERGKPKIVLNPMLAKSLGIEFNASVLKVARLVH